MVDELVIAGKKYQSRLLVGTGRYQNFSVMKESIEASGADIVTVAIRRASNENSEAVEDYISPHKYTYLPNSSGCYNATEAVRALKLAREIGGWNLVKLEVIGDKKTLFPDMTETLKAADILAKDGFLVMAYANDDPIFAKRLEEVGCVAVMPLAAPIGSGLGIINKYNILTIIENANIPILIDAGIGTASDAAIAMEMGCDGVLLNTAIIEANDPVKMARAMKYAVIAGREAFLAGRMAKRDYAVASSPVI